ncbi:hypothetical protein AYK26_04745 [Euryarchaeota archaeon SM23-78]|nr:MAG: hypothetical protein AYK26_04745 [Euryarchaeota archaeon SM23-78]MBW3000748.1 polyprenyl synthetase family protein [Candidatus Woesearchaeota archaeon]
MNEIEEYIQNQRETINKIIKSDLKEEFLSDYIHHQAAAYTVYPQGRRYRSMLSLELYQMLGGDKPNFLKSIAGLEFIHHASLIFDDLPCMDNSNKRKGKETTHEKYGEDTAILTGLYLYNRGRKLIFKNAYQHLDNTDEVEMLVYDMTDKMLIGQETDLRKEKSNMELLDSMYKKNILFHLASVLPAYLLKNKENLRNLDMIGVNLSIGYQLFDDLRDYEGNPQITGKPVNVDSDNSINRLGPDTVKKSLIEKKKMIIDNLREIQPDSKLEQIIEYMLTKPS